MMGVSCTSCGHHFAIYVNETITPRALHLHSDVRQLFLNEAGKKHAVSSYSLNVHYKIMWPAIYGFKIANSVFRNSSCMFECYEVETIHENASEATN